MTERPILFSAPMVRAILAGTKTQTRRIVKWRDLDAGLNLGFTGLRAVHISGVLWALESDTRTSVEHRCDATRCPYGTPGDRLWVREAHSIGPGPGVPLEVGETCGALRWPHITYTADGAVERRDTRWKGAFGVGRPSIHMPRWASRITLDITAVRVERLQDISEGDAHDEGTGEWAAETQRDGNKWPLWESINGPGSWNANPWVWVVEFRRSA